MNVGTKRTILQEVVFWVVALAIMGLVLLVYGAQAAQAQVNVSFTWDKSDSDTRDPAAVNPVKYALYVCTDAAMTTCNKNAADTNLTKTVSLSAGSYWVYCTAYWLAYVIEGVGSGPEQESGKSNIVAFRLLVPPGNPANFKIRIP